MDTAREHLLTEVLVEFARTLGTDFSVGQMLDHLAQRAAEILPVSGAGVILMAPSRELRTIAACDDAALRLESTQNELSEGPCLQACASGEAVLVPDLSRDDRFTRFARATSALGLAAVFTFPLRTDGTTLGALDLYRGTAGDLADEDCRAAQVLADVAAAYVMNARARVDASATLARLSHRSLHDPLTGLPNRTLLEERLDHAVARTRRSRRLAAVLFVDLDGFKAVNDRYGHDVGDRLLCAVAERLTAVLRPGDTLARLGGDEFVVVCEELVVATDAESVAGRITAAVAAPFPLDGHSVRVTASVGIAFADGDVPGARARASGLDELGDHGHVLLRDADFAMYQVKERGGAGHQVVDPAARLAAERRHQLERDVADAHRRGELSLVYQPLRTVGERHLTGYEALLRWNHPEHGPVPAEEAVAAAERTHRIAAVGEWVLRRACTDLRRWQERADPDASVCVNVSPDQVVRPGFAENVRTVLAETRVDPGSVVLELTEHVLLADTERTRTVLHELKETGLRLALDDFGTGYSSLNYLRHFPFDVVKVDRSFVADLGVDAGTRSIVRAVVDLSHELGLGVVAEGVETERQMRGVAELGVDLAQGWLLGRPVPAECLDVEPAAAPAV